MDLAIRVRGVTPLLTHNPLSMQTTAAGRGNNIPSPEEEAERGAYRLPDGTCGIPGISFRSAIVKAAGAWKHRRSSMASVLSHVTISEELIPLTDAEGSPLKSFTIDRRRAIVQRQGVVRSRPRFDDWHARFTIEYDPELVADPGIISAITADAGKRIGVGDYRPERKGWFGRFAVLEEMPA